MSLADELVADFEEGGEEDPEESDLQDAPELVEDVTMETEIKQDSVRSIAKLQDSEQVAEIHKYFYIIFHCIGMA